MNEQQQHVATAVCQDKEGGLHLLLQERRFTENRVNRQLDVVTVDIPLTEQGAQTQYYAVRVIEKKEQTYVGRM